jgi:hypothetical protein
VCHSMGARATSRSVRRLYRFEDCMYVTACVGDRTINKCEMPLWFDSVIAVEP